MFLPFYFQQGGPSDQKQLVRSTCLPRCICFLNSYSFKFGCFFNYWFYVNIFDWEICLFVKIVIAYAFNKYEIVLIHRFDPVSAAMWSKVKRPSWHSNILYLVGCLWLPGLFKSGQWHFHQDNTPVHNSIFVIDYLTTKMGIKTVPHPPYSPDLAPCDFWLFPKLKGCRYKTIEEMKEAVTKVMDTLTQEDFHGAFQKFLERYNKCIAAEEIISKGTRVSCVYYQ